jgi:hypothetical protein
MTFRSTRGTEFLPWNETYKVSPKGWLQRLCWRFLQQRNAVARFIEQRELVQEIAIDPNQVATDAIMQALDQLEAVGYRASKLLIGRDAFLKMRAYQGLPAFMQPVAFGADVQSLHPPLLGLEVQIVPHMEGILVL